MLQQASTGPKAADCVKVVGCECRLILLLLIGLAGVASAKPWWMRGVESNESDFLPPDVAFRVSASVEGKDIRVRWIIADGYYLYRQKIDIKAESPDLVLAAPELPKAPSKPILILELRKSTASRPKAQWRTRRLDAGAHPMQIKVTYQGCADAGLCYPPIIEAAVPRASGHRAAAPAQHPWEGVAILGGGIAFLWPG